MKTRILLFALAVMAMFSSNSYAQSTAESSDAILQKAYAQAAKEHKNVMVLFHASWCGWCKKMDASLNEPSIKKSFDDNYVIIWLTVLENTPEMKKNENPEAMELLAKYHADKTGIPFFLIFDSKGKFLADSFIRAPGISMDKPGENMGCPASVKEVAAFNEILKQTSRIKEPQLTLIRNRFVQNEEPQAHPVVKPASSK
jgi:thioredoxin-related protein